MRRPGINRGTLYIQNSAIAKEGSGEGCLTSCGDPLVGSISQERHHQTGDAAHTVHEARKCSEKYIAFNSESH